MSIKIDRAAIAYIITFTLITLLIVIAANIELISQSYNMTSTQVIYAMFLNIILLNLLILSISILLASKNKSATP